MVGIDQIGDAISTPGPRGQRQRDDHFLLLFNASPAPIEFALPDLVDPDHWTLVLDTAATDNKRGIAELGPRVEVA
ncbi:MAG: hypothetical protein AAFN30_10290, partial [Actinomycetota bacterium]